MGFWDNVQNDIAQNWQGTLLGLVLVVVIFLFTRPTTPKKKAVQAVIDRDNYKGIVLTMEEVAKHNAESSAWLVVHDRVHDVTKYVRFHPGGRDKILQYAGKEATVAFMGDQHPISAKDVLAEYYIGDLIRA